MARVASGEITLIDVADGDPAPRLSSRRLFKALTSVPQTPAATITWATNALSNIETGWSETSPTQQAISTTTVYFSDLLFSDTTGVATTTTATGTSPLPVTTFSGLVTYNSGSGAFAVDGGSITSIDGGNLATGSITAGMGVFSGPLKSSNFSTLSAGWQITAAGDAEFNNLINRSDIVDGAVSNGGVIVNAASPTHYANGTYVTSYDFGATTSSEIWQFGVSVSMRHAFVGEYYSGKDQTPYWSGRYLEVQPQWRLKEGGVWGSWTSLGPVLNSNSYTVWRTQTASTLVFGEFEGVEFRLYVSHRMNIGLAAPGYTSAVNILNLKNVNYVGRALVK